MSVAANKQIGEGSFAALSAGDRARMRERLHPDPGWTISSDTPACKTICAIDGFETCLIERALVGRKLQGAMSGSACRGQQMPSQSS